MALDRTAREAAERCLHCPKLCTYACPVGRESAREAHTPWATMSLVAQTVAQAPLAPPLPGPLKSLAKRALELVDGRMARALDADEAETFYACTGCLRCQTACEHGTDVPSVLLAARAEAASRGLAPAGARATAEKIQRHGHAASGDPSDALAQLASRNPSASQGGVLFAGCEAPVSSPGAVQAALDASRKLGAPLLLAREPICCGRELYEAGLRSEFKAHVAKAWEMLGDREVVVLSAACGRALSEWAEAVGVEPRGPVAHVTTHLAKRLGPSVQGRPVPGRVAYHDPCHLGRGLGEYEAPRRLLELATEGGVTECDANREHSDCCGAGGLVPATFPEVARSMSMARADELRATGVSRVATACPSCRRSLEAAGLDVVDVVELVAQWLENA